MEQSVKSIIKKVTVIFAAVLICTAFTHQCYGQKFNTKFGNATEDQQYLAIIEELYFYIQENYVDEVDANKLYQGAVKGMLESLDDPYSAYLDTAGWRAISDTTTGSFGGVGLYISKSPVSTPEDPAYVNVSMPIENSPGAKAGIKSGDLIIKINGTDTSTITMEEVLDKLRGPVGESVQVTIRRGKTYEFDVTLVREIIENITVKYAMIDSIGYISMTEFSVNTTAKIQEALDFFKSSSYTGLIIDLRYNGGGLLSTAVNIADKFIDEGMIVSTKSRISYQNAQYKASASKTKVKNIPVVILVNKASASASEVLAGALKDTKKAVLVGEKTYGKGSVQVPTQLFDNDGFKLTIAKYYSPSDSNIDGVGIEPDVEVTFPELSDEEEKAYVEILNSGEIEAYVENKGTVTEDDIRAFSKSLAEKYNLAGDSAYLRKLIRNRSENVKTAKIYDLDYDVQLNKALEIAKNPAEYEKILKNSKTLKEMELQQNENKEGK